jgi:hypothetical protein
MLIFDQFPSTASANLFAMTAQRLNREAFWAVNNGLNAGDGYTVMFPHEY